MHRIALVLACFVCAFHGRRMHSRRNTEGQQALKLRDQNVFSQLQALVRIFTAECAFNPTLSSLPVRPRNLRICMRETKSKTRKKETKGFGTVKKKKPKDTFKYGGDIRPEKLSPTRLVPKEIARPDYADDGVPKLSDQSEGYRPGKVEKKSAKDIEGMRVAGRLAREVLDAAGRAVAVGVTTDEIDRVAHEATIARGAYPSPLNYCGFPKSCCTSVNEVMAHGIPDARPLKDGDIVNIDITVYYGGYHGDCSEMFLVGNVDEAGKNLVKVTYDAWQAGIEYCAPGKLYGGIGGVVEDHIIKQGYLCVKEFCGHGIGKIFHQQPTIEHYRNDFSNQGKMEIGHTFTIEPIVCEGDDARILQWKDGWTATTRTGGRAAQFEHTFLVTPNGVEALTARLPDSQKFWWEEADDEKTEE